MFTSGFFNSIGGNRKYSAEQLSSIFDGVITDGIYANCGDFLSVVPGTGMEVIVKSGRAWFNHTWSLNDSNMPLTIDAGDVLRTRIDAVVLEINKTIPVLENSIKVIKGEASVNPVRPSLEKSGDIYQYALAYVTVNPEAESITETDISVVVGQDETPFVTAPLQTVSISDLFQTWNGQFNDWFNNLKAQLSDNVVANLQGQIDEKVSIYDEATDEDVKNGTSGKWIGSSNFNDLISNSSYKVGDVINTARTNLGDKWALCNGALVDKISHPELYDLILSMPVLQVAYNSYNSPTIFYNPSKYKLTSSDYAVIGEDGVGLVRMNYRSTASGSSIAGIVSFVFKNHFSELVGDNTDFNNVDGLSYACLRPDRVVYNYYATSSDKIKWTSLQIAVWNSIEDVCTSSDTRTVVTPSTLGVTNSLRGRTYPKFVEYNNNYYICRSILVSSENYVQIISSSTIDFSTNLSTMVRSRTVSISNAYEPIYYGITDDGKLIVIYMIATFSVGKNIYVDVTPLESGETETFVDILDPNIYSIKTLIPNESGIRMFGNYIVLASTEKEKMAVTVIDISSHSIVSRSFNMISEMTINNIIRIGNVLYIDTADDNNRSIVIFSDISDLSTGVVTNHSIPGSRSFPVRVAEHVDKIMDVAVGYTDILSANPYSTQFIRAELNRLPNDIEHLYYTYIKCKE